MGRGGRRRRGAKRAREDSSEEKAPSSSVDVSLWKGDTESCSASKTASEIPVPLSADYFDDPKTPAAHQLSEPYSSLLSLFWKALKARKEKWSEPSQIQLHSWPILLSCDERYWNLIQLAPTGSGKTLAYGIPLLIQAMCVEGNQNSRNNGLVLVPTRELAQQITKELLLALKFARSDGLETSLSILALYGGVSKKAQVEELHGVLSMESVAVILVATPGRLTDLVDRNAPIDNDAPHRESEKHDQSSVLIASRLQNLLSHSMRMIILDEADRLASNTDLGLQVENILRLCSSRRRLCLCTATWPERVLHMWTKWLESRCNPGPSVLIEVDIMKVGDQNSKRIQAGVKSSDPQNKKDFDVHEQVTEKLVKSSKDLLSQIPAHLTQTLHVCAEHKKPRKLLNTLQKISKEDSASRHTRLGIVFFARIKTLKYISSFLSKEGISSCELHSHMNQSNRDQNVQNFKCGKIRLLLATDIAARGLHIQNVSYIVNYDFPGNLEQYIHRCGRAGRGVGASECNVFSFFTRNLAPMASDVVQLLEASSQWIDPNLRELLKESDENTTTTRGNASRLSGNAEERIESEADDDIVVPQANRIVLRKASNVSDPSSSSGEEDDDED